jgi:hypothetical protein
VLGTEFNSCAPSSCVETLLSNVTAFRDRDVKEIIKVK